VCVFDRGAEKSKDGKVDAVAAAAPALFLVMHAGKFGQ
jgi:hypothetical protein